MDAIRSKMFQLSLLLFCFTPAFAADRALTTSNSPVPSSLQSPGDWDKLFNACEGDWDQYESGLNKLRGNLKREIDAMAQHEFMRRYQKDDPMIRFVRVHWPILFSGKDTGWKIYQGCAERNLGVRKLFGTTGSTVKERAAKIDNLRGCVEQVFSPNQPVPPPFDRLLECYRRRLK